MIYIIKTVLKKGFFYLSIPIIALYINHSILDHDLDFGWWVLASNASLGDKTILESVIVNQSDIPIILSQGLPLTLPKQKNKAELLNGQKLENTTSDQLYLFFIAAPNPINPFGNVKVTINSLYQTVFSVSLVTEGKGDKLFQFQSINIIPIPAHVVLNDTSPFLPGVTMEWSELYYYR